MQIIFIFTICNTLKQLTMENRKSNEIKMTNFLDLFYLLSIMFSSFVLFIKIVKMAL